MKHIFFWIALGLIVTTCAPQALAAKPRIRSKATKSVTKAPAGISYSSARLSRATNSVIVTFKNLSNVARITYTLSYRSNSRTSSPQEQGVVGSIVPSGAATEQRDLYFGTCSKGVCTPHYQITNAMLLVETTLKNGSTNTKRYRIKI